MVNEIQIDANCEVAEVANVPGFVMIADQTIKLSQIRAYTNGQIVGMDVSSGIATLALSVEQSNNVLDLCCAPGAKLLFAAELLDNSRILLPGTANDTPKGSVTGVDIASHRAAICRSLVKKYGGLDKAFVRIYVEDGTEFDIRAPQTGWWDPKSPIRASSTKNKKPWFATRLIGSDYACSGNELYDRVLVDAECTHDGSLVHVNKYEKFGWEHLDTKVVGNNRPTSIPVLQSKLLENGWRLLKPGGILVYSTCSLSRYQNEFVLGGFLKRHGEDEAQVEAIPMPNSNDPENTSAVHNITMSAVWTPTTDEDYPFKAQNQGLFDRMANAARLDPMVSTTSGMFIARIRKSKSGSARTFTNKDIVPL